MAVKNDYLDLAAPGIAGLAPYEPGKPPAELERELGIRDAVKLASNENPRGAPPEVRDAVLAAAEHIERYPDGTCFELRAALAGHLNVEREQITFGNGSNEVLVLLAETFLTPAHNAIYDQYSFVVYRLAVQGCGAEARVTPALPAHADDQPLGHDLQAMLAQVDERTRLVFIANPNNPTGTWVDQSALKSFLAALPEHVLVVLDEAYVEYARQDAEDDTLTWLLEFPSLVIVRTFSKAYGLASLRLGYAVSSPAVAELLNRVRQPFNVNGFAQVAASAALGAQDWVAESVQINKEGLKRLEEGVTRLGLSFIASRGNFLLVDMATAGRAAGCNSFLEHQGVIVRPVSNYGLPNYLRMTVGTDAQLTKLLDALAKFIGAAHE